MGEQRIRVGIVGVNPQQGWAARAHIPALRSLPEYEITAVGTSRIESARAAAEHFGVAHAFADARELAEHPEVDLVVVTVKVPAHLELVGAALAAGKHVYCEWPLARTTEEAELLVAAAESAGVRTAIGLQARYAPALLQARELIGQGYLGELGSVTVYSGRAKGAGERMPDWALYTLDRASAAGTLEVAGGHTLDAVQHLVGELASLQADLTIRRSSYLSADGTRRIAVTSPDQVLVNGRLGDGAAVSAHIHDGRSAGAGTRIELVGSEGVLVLESSGPAGPGGIQMGALRLRAGREVGGELVELDLPPRHFAADPARTGDEGFHVGQLYARLAADLRSGERTVPDFAEGLRLHRVLDAVRRAAGTGVRQSIG
ncbi:Gfo/Idh/MocA family protein [Kitasatospora viridis]|uniref:Putative dehydrogenase n=1 Tax=Kitasatospora viridis TaxID=281105 RepID=A0A561UPK7_9ACTN|nr:Gfo/Idh/MocA family oxidoreductase [Kitasatospora viridis]TWG01274.1 putative dehydrogenase [Kitasatospora viridis]